jgi:hypothetical protein
MNAQTRSTVFTPKLVLGLSLIALGLILTLDQLGWWGAWGFLRFWPLIPAAFGLARLLQRGWLHLSGHFWLGFALVGLAAQWGREDLIDRWWPVLLVWGGAVITLRALLPRSPAAPVSCDPENDLPEKKP